MLQKPACEEMKKASSGQKEVKERFRKSAPAKARPVRSVSEVEPPQIVHVGEIESRFGGRRHKTFAGVHWASDNDRGALPPLCQPRPIKPDGRPSPPYGASGAAWLFPPPLAATASSDFWSERISFWWAFTCLTSLSRRSPMDLRYRTAVSRAAASHL